MPHSSPSSAGEPSLNVPQVVIVLILGYIVYRAFFKSAPQSPPQRPPAVDPNRLARHVETLQGIFPHVSRAALEAELIRNGGSIEIATERMLSPGGLPEPAGSQSQRPSPRSPVASRPTNPQSRPQAQSGAGPSTTAPMLVQYPDLLTRYNLHHRLREEMAADEAAVRSGKARGKAPATKQDRMLAHKEKRDEMILAARRRVEKMDKP